MIKKSDLDKTVVAINYAAERINLQRRYEIEHGSDAKGTRYKLLEFNPAFTHPYIIEFANTRLDALRYLEGVAAGLDAVERELKRRGVAQGVLPANPES